MLYIVTSHYVLLIGINPGKSDTIDKITSIIVNEFKRVCVFNVTDDKATEGLIV